MATKKKKDCCHDESSHSHPDHSPVLPRLNRVKGQIEGIEKMISDQRYCVDILIQFKAAMAALRNLEVEVFEKHLHHCVEQAMQSRDPKEIDRKISELTQLLARRTQL
jgi:DNA-binding FrmR family transcriptional regulator